MQNGHPDQPEVTETVAKAKKGYNGRRVLAHGSDFRRSVAPGRQVELIGFRDELGHSIERRRIDRTDLGDHF